MQNEMDNDELEQRKDSKVGNKRKRGDFDNANVIGNMHEIEESKEQPRRSPRRERQQTPYGKGKNRKNSPTRSKSPKISAPRLPKHENIRYVLWRYHKHM